MLQRRVVNRARESVMGNQVANEVIYRLEWYLSRALSRTKTTNQFVAYFEYVPTISPPATVHRCTVVFCGGPLPPVQTPVLNERYRLDYQYSPAN